MALKLMAIYLSFLVPKITAIVHAMPTKAQPTPSVWNHEHDRLSDFIPIASLLEWQWCQIVMGKCHPSRNGASQTAQCREIPHSFPEPFYPALQAQAGKPTPHPSLRFHQKLVQVQQILERPSEGGRLCPNADTKLS